MKKLKIAFVCTHNSCRSIMAEGWMRHLSNNEFDVYSAGTSNYPEPKPLALEVMTDLGIDMSHASSKLLKDIPNQVDILITMGCGVECPFVSCQHREDWGLDDPSGKGKLAFEKTQRMIRDKVIHLIERIHHGQLL